MNIDAESLVDLVANIGQSLSMESRPYYVSYISGLNGLVPFMQIRAALALGVFEFPPMAILFNEWGNAVAKDDGDRAQELEYQFMEAGVSEIAFEALDAAKRLAIAMMALGDESVIRSIH